MKTPSGRAHPARRAHARHDPHVSHDIGAVRDLHPDFSDGRADGPHAEGNDIHRPPGHAAVEQPAQRRPHLGRGRPIVGGTGVVLIHGAYERPILDPADVGRMRAREKRVRTLLWVEADEGSGVHHRLAKPVVFPLRSVAPHDLVGLAQRRHLFDPGASLALVGALATTASIVLLSIDVGHLARMRFLRLPHFEKRPS